MSIDIQIKYITNTKGERFFTQRWVPARPKALITLVHGFGDHSGRYAHVINHFANQGYAVGAYDLRGHGLSDGRRGDFRKFDQHLADLHSFVWETAHEVSPGTPVVVLGTGAGALVAMHYATTYPRAVAGVVAVSPVLQPTVQVGTATKRFLIKRCEGLFPRLRVDYHYTSHDLTRDPEARRAYETDERVFKHLTVRAHQDCLEKLKYIMPLAFRLRHPLLMMQAKGDRISSSDASERFFSEVIQDDKKLILFDGAFHEPFNDTARDEALSAVDEWLASVIVGQEHATGVTGKGWNLK
jgi:alpha-beta hydrolase superfamily lysophospholipase